MRSKEMKKSFLLPTRIYIKMSNLKNSILIDDGLIGLEVKKIKGHDIVCTVINGGVLSNKKGVNLPMSK